MPVLPLHRANSAKFLLTRFRSQEAECLFVPLSLLKLIGSVYSTF